MSYERQIQTLLPKHALVIMIAFFIGLFVGISQFTIRLGPNRSSQLRNRGIKC